jgi:kynurenine formamidase
MRKRADLVFSTDWSEGKKGRVVLAADSRASNWGRWGDEDERGALNLIGAEEVCRAARLVRRGRVFQLGMPIQATGVPSYPSRPPALHLMARHGGDYLAGAVARGNVGTADDYLGLATHGVTHIDALSHLWYDDALYNGVHPREVRGSGAARNGIDKIGPIVARGVLLDVAGAAGLDRLAGGYPIGIAELEECLRRQQIAVGAGDVVLVRTGWLTQFVADAAVYNDSQPGLSASTVPWLVERDVAVVGADNIAVECMPDPGGENAPLHQRLLRDYGVHLLELLDLEELAAEKVWEFLFIAAPLRIKRGVGSPLNPVAVV